MNTVDTPVRSAKYSL